MARPLTDREWALIRHERESGVTLTNLAYKYGISATVINNRSVAESWPTPKSMTTEERRDINEKTVGHLSVIPTEAKLGDAPNPAIDNEKAADLLRRHREESHSIRERLYAGLREHKVATAMCHSKATREEIAQARERATLAIETLKVAKIGVETMAILHKIERQAYNMDTIDSKPNIVIERSYS